MGHINISLEALKEIVKKASKELGGTNGTVCLQINDNLSGGCWSSKEKYYKRGLSHHHLGVEKGQFYSLEKEFSQLILDK